MAIRLTRCNAIFLRRCLEQLFRKQSAIIVLIAIAFLAPTQTTLADPPSKRATNVPASSNNEEIPPPAPPLLNLQHQYILSGIYNLDRQFVINWDKAIAQLTAQRRKLPQVVAECVPERNFMRKINEIRTFVQRHELAADDQHAKEHCLWLAKALLELKLDKGKMEALKNAVASSHRTELNLLLLCPLWPTLYNFRKAVNQAVDRLRIEIWLWEPAGHFALMASQIGLRKQLIRQRIDRLVDTIVEARSINKVVAKLITKTKTKFREALPVIETRINVEQHPAEFNPLVTLLKGVLADDKQHQNPLLNTVNIAIFDEAIEAERNEAVKRGIEELRKFAGKINEEVVKLPGLIANAKVDTSRRSEAKYVKMEEMEEYLRLRRFELLNSVSMLLHKHLEMVTLFNHEDTETENKLNKLLTSLWLLANSWLEPTLNELHDEEPELEKEIKAWLTEMTEAEAMKEAADDHVEESLSSTRAIIERESLAKIAKNLMPDVLTVERIVQQMGNSEKDVHWAITLSAMHVLSLYGRIEKLFGINSDILPNVDMHQRRQLEKQVLDDIVPIRLVQYIFQRYTEAEAIRSIEQEKLAQWMKAVRQQQQQVTLRQQQVSPAAVQATGSRKKKKNGTAVLKAMFNGIKRHAKRK